MFGFALVVLRCRVFIALRRTVACGFTRALQFHRRTYPTTALNCIVRYSNFGRSVSALGQKRTWRRFHPMSALPPKADMDQSGCDVRFVPLADIERGSEPPVITFSVGETWSLGP